jgi:hypothetical protein
MAKLKGTQLSISGIDAAAPPPAPEPAPKRKRRGRPPKTSPWVSTATAARELGCSTDFLYRHRGELFQLRQHYKVLNPTAWRPTYRWHLPNCQQLMEGE